MRVILQSESYTNEDSMESSSSNLWILISIILCTIIVIMCIIACLFYYRRQQRIMNRLKSQKGSKQTKINNKHTINMEKANKISCNSPKIKTIYNPIENKNDENQQNQKEKEINLQSSRSRPKPSNNTNMLLIDENSELIKQNETHYIQVNYSLFTKKFVVCFQRTKRSKEQKTKIKYIYNIKYIA